MLNHLNDYSQMGVGTRVEWAQDLAQVVGRSWIAGGRLISGRGLMMGRRLISGKELDGEQEADIW